MHKTSLRILVSTVLVITFALISCTPFVPYRTQDPHLSVACASDSQGKLVKAKACLSAPWETDSDYDLFFAEFDDQGLLHPGDEEHSGKATEQVDAIDSALRERFAGKLINLIVYVHGWKHNAKSDDEDVEAFRKLLHSVKTLENVSEEQSGSRLLDDSAPDTRHVVGVYVGWRGLSSSLEPFKELSFWGRKETANRVAIGSARELFSRLWAYENMRNDVWDKKVLAKPDESSTVDAIKDPSDRPPVQMLIIGHSFGAQLVYSALAENLTEALSGQLKDPNARIRRYGDMVVLVNPAFEANRYLPLLRVARGRQYDHYLAPLLVTVTTTNDWATGKAFPIGRWFGTRFEHYSSAGEARDAMRTAGHLPELITHELTVSPDSEDTTCHDWKIPGSASNAEPILKSDIKLEQVAAGNFFSAHKAIVYGHLAVVLPNKWTRHFCGGMNLEFVKGTGSNAVDANMPVWNIETHPPIIDGHNGFKTEEFFAFVRQLRADAVDYVAIMSPPLNAVGPDITARNRHAGDRQVIHSVTDLGRKH